MAANPTMANVNDRRPVFESPSQAISGNIRAAAANGGLI
jgi:hypothetical protein